MQAARAKECAREESDRVGASKDQRSERCTREADETTGRLAHARARRLEPVRKVVVGWIERRTRPSIYSRTLDSDVERRET